MWSLCRANTQAQTFDLQPCMHALDAHKIGAHKDDNG